MKPILRLLALCLPLLIGVSLVESRASTRNELAVTALADERSLLEILEEIGRKYDVLISYETSLVRDVQMDFELLPDEDLEAAFNRLLDDSNFSFELLEEKYVLVYKNDRYSRKTARKIRRKIQQLDKLQERGTLSLSQKHSNQGMQLQNLKTFVREQNKVEEVTGTVTDENGEPLIGVNIQVKGSNIGTTTDFDGHFTLEDVQNGEILVISYIGYITREVEVEIGSSISIELEESAETLDEVVVVGYSSKRQSELSSAVSIVHSEDLEGVTTNNLGDMLQGKVPGVRISNSTGRPGNDPQIVIRGVGSMNAGFAPLVVVDGIIGGTYNPSDIKTVTILKDAAATGLYGSRAANGVIVITTKSGESGKTSINFQVSQGSSYHSDGNLDVMNADELYNYHKTAATNSYNLLENPTQSLEEFLSGTVPTSMLDYKTNWQELLKRRGTIGKYQISLSGGSDKTTFYLSGNYFKELGTMINMEYERIDLRSNISHKISDMFDLDLRIAANRSKNPNEPQGGQEGLYSQYHIAMPFDRPYHDDGPPVDPFDPNVNWFGNSRSNYFFNREHYEDNTQRFNVSMDIQLTAHLAEWITFTTTNRLTFHSSERNQLFDQFHALGASAGGLINNRLDYSNSILTSNKFNLAKRFNLHKFNGIVGQEYNRITNKFLTGEGMDLPLGLEALNSVGSPRNVGGNTSEFGFQSFFAQLDYNYDQKYFLIASYRKDASSRFGKDNRWGDFYSVGASWMLSREEILRSVSWLDLLKFKISYGLTGNANIGNYLSLSSYNFSNGYAGNSAAIPSRIANPNLTWEIAHTTNIGMELFALNRFEFGLDYYVRDNRDLLQDVPLSAATGFSSQRKNIGTVRNRGIDIYLTSKNITGNFNWNTTFNVSFNNSEILKLDGGNDIASGNMRFSEGYPLRSWYMKEWIGVDPGNGEPMWARWEDQEGNLIHQTGGPNANLPTVVTTTNNQNEASLLFIGSPYPDFVGGMRNVISYKGFQFNILTNFSKGNTVFASIRSRMDSDGAFTSHNKMNLQPGWSRWEKPGDVATHPQLLYNGNNNSYNPSSRFIEDASFIRIQNIKLGYRFRNFSPELLKNLNLNLSIDNIYTWTKYSGADPAINMENPVSNQNSNNGSYAPPSTIVLGVSFNL